MQGSKGALAWVFRDLIMIRTGPVALLSFGQDVDIRLRPGKLRSDSGSLGLRAPATTWRTMGLSKLRGYSNCRYSYLTYKLI